MDVFLFGSQVHAPLRAQVLGCDLAGRPARLGGWQPVAAAPRGPATLIARDGAVAPGLVLEGLDPRVADRLAYFTAVHGCRPDTVTLDGRDVRVFLADVPQDVPQDEPQDGPQEAPAFDATDWARDWAPLWSLAAEEIMAQHGRLEGAAFGAHRLRAVETRAAARLRADERPRPSAFDLDRDVVVHARHLPYLNFFSLAEIDLQYRRHDGTLGPVMNRAALKVGDAAIVLPYDPVRDCVLLVQQFRAAPYVAGDSSPWIWEAPAGLVDPGETPPEAALREAVEEARLTLDRLEPVAQAYSSTGSSTEFSHIFVGIADLRGAGAVAGVEAEGEDIRSEVIPFARFLDDLQAGRHVNLQLVTAGLWLALNRERLRRAG